MDSDSDSKHAGLRVSSCSVKLELRFDLREARLRLEKGELIASLREFIKYFQSIVVYYKDVYIVLLTT